MGIGALGSAAAKALTSLGFHVNGWSRTGTKLDGVASFHGEAGLVPFLNATDILVVLLPLTPATTGIVDYKLLRSLQTMTDEVTVPGTLIGIALSTMFPTASLPAAFNRQFMAMPESLDAAWPFNWPAGWAASVSAKA